MLVGINKEPQLRFPEFGQSWFRLEFGKMAVLSKVKYDPQKDNKDYPCLELESISKDSSLILKIFSSQEQKSIKNKFKKGEILFGKLRPNLRKYVIAPFNGVCSSEIWVLAGREVSNEFLFQMIQTNKFYKVSTVTSGSKMPRSDWNFISSFPFFTPSLHEQQKIASFLSAVDKKIQQLARKKELLEQYKKGVMQKIFSQEIRFKPAPSESEGDENGEDYPEWEEKELGKIADRITTKNITNSVNHVLTNSATQGVVSQNDYFDKGIANQNKLEGYYIVSKDDFVYNPRISVHAPVGPIKRNKLKEGVMSPLYSVFRFTEENLEYFEFYFETIGWHRYLNSVANFGARHDRMNITNSDFLSMPIPYPCIQERGKISIFLLNISNKIESTTKKLDQTQQFKKGLLQQMFV